LSATSIPATVRAIFFDAVGTLVYPEPAAPAVYAAIGRRYGSAFDETSIAARFRIAFHRQEEWDRAAGWRTSEAREIERWRSIVGEVLSDSTNPEACFQALFAHFARAESWQIDPDAPAVLASLASRGYVLGVASNYDQRLRSVAAGIPEFARFAHLAISAEIGWRKPASEFFAAVCEKSLSRADQVLVVGDDFENDCQGARAAGLHAMVLDRQNRLPARNRIGRLNDLLC